MMNGKKLSDLLAQLQEEMPENPLVKEATSLADEMYGAEEAEDEMEDPLAALDKEEAEKPAPGKSSVDDLLAKDSGPAGEDDMSDIFGSAKPAMPPKKKKKPEEEEEDESVSPPKPIVGSF